MKKEKDEIIKVDGKEYTKEKFLIEEEHPAIGRILIIGDLKLKVLDDYTKGSHKSGTFVSELTKRDVELMKEYDEALDELSAKLTDKVDVKRLIKENIKSRPIQDIKTGLFILKAKEDGEDVEEEHHQGCYHYKIHYKNQTFDFCAGDDVINNPMGTSW